MSIEIGVSYYPEDWDMERIRYDAELMAACGVRYVRMAEFSWSHLEAAEGVFDFQWLHEAVDVLGSHGIMTILCTPTSAAPAWMCRAYPEILRMKRDGTRAWFGVRDHTCYTSRKYREFTRRIVGRLAEEFGGSQYVKGWQIDNETGCSRFPDCCCADCQAAFQEHLKKKYGSLEVLNKAWGTTFWSGEFRSWEEIELENRMEEMGSCRMLESNLFRSMEQRDFILMQADEIRKKSPNAIIGTNNYCLADRYDVFSSLDYAGADLYPFDIGNWRDIAFELDVYRSVKPGVASWIMETLVGGGWPRYDFDPLVFWQFAGHGNDKIFYFHWNHHEAGNEKDHPTVISMTGEPGWRYEKLKKLIAESHLLPKELPQPESACALVYDYDNQWRYALGFSKREQLFNVFSLECHSAMRGNGDAVDIISSGFDFTKYRLVVMPNHCYVSEKLAEKLKRYVFAGGVLLMNGRVGMFDEYGKNLIQKGPDRIADLLGIRFGEDRIMAQTPENPRASQIPVYRSDEEFARHNAIVLGKLGEEEVEGVPGVWTCFLETDGETEVLLRFGESCLKGMPFLTSRKYGKGVALYYASDTVNQQLLSSIIRHAKRLAGLTSSELPANVDIMRRGDYVFLCNFNDHAIEMEAPASNCENVIGTALCDGRIILQPYSGAVIRQRSLPKAGML